MATIANTIKKIRTEKELSQEDMARDLGVSSNYISLMENGRKKPGMSFLKKLSKKYSIPLILLTQEMIIPQATTKKEREIRDRVVSLINELEGLMLQS